MKTPWIALAAMLVPGVAAATEPKCNCDSGPPYAHPKFARTLVGFGGVPDLPSANATLTTEIGGRPFSGKPWEIGAFSTGVGFSSTTDLTGRFTVVALGIFVKMDLTHLLAGGLWSTYPPGNFPFRVQVGSRLGLGVSDSFLSASRGPDAAPREQNKLVSYVLLRPEMQYFLDLEIPIDERRVHSFVIRGALDTSVNGADLFRGSVSIGIDYGWDNG